MPACMHAVCSPGGSGLNRRKSRVGLEVCVEHRDVVYRHSKTKKSEEVEKKREEGKAREDTER